MVDVEHERLGLFGAFAEDAGEYPHHKLHGGEVVVVEVDRESAGLADGGVLMLPGVGLLLCHAAKLLKICRSVNPSFFRSIYFLLKRRIKDI